MTTYPTITTSRLILRSPHWLDIPEIARLANDKEVIKGTSNMPFPYTEEAALNWINICLNGFKSGDTYKFAIELKDTKKFIGGMGLNINKPNNNAELGYWFGRDHWNKGYASEVLPVVIKFGFEELNLKKIHATHFPYNLASGKVMEKCGMLYEGKLKEHVKKDNEYLDLIQYGIINSNYKII